MQDFDVADRKLIRIMDAAANGVLADPERAYEICIETCGPLTNQPVFSSATHASEAFVVWARISDLQDDHRGPSSEELCRAIAVEVSELWLNTDHDSGAVIASFFRQAEELVNSAFSY